MTRDHEKNCLKKKHRYQTRRFTNLNIPRAMTKRYKSSFFVQGLVVYDKLPVELKTEDKYGLYTCKLKKWLPNA